ncbi:MULTISPECIES: RNA polymerase sigma factor ShbA [Actinosynnema]|uniref:RNA polymerase sigma factor ShbA n=1 Tax=Actinosynnema TaxID=40566 RepID=UPI0035575A2B
MRRSRPVTGKQTIAGDGADAAAGRGRFDFGQVQAAARGDRDAARSLMAVVRPVVVRYCRARVGRRDGTFASADDVAQEVCLAVLTALPDYRDQGRPFLAFVYGIAAHKVAATHRASARNRSESFETAPHTDPPDRVTRLLRVLSDKQREILVLRIAVGLSAEETAQAVGSTPGAVRVAQHRALARLQKVQGAGQIEVGAALGSTVWE